MNDSESGTGWIVFAGIMVLIAGTLNVIWGIAAISTSKFFIVHANYILSDLHTWGWIVLLIGIVELFAAYSIWNGGEFGRWFGIVMATLNAIAALMTIRAYPLWGLCLFAVDILIIYALVAYGGEGLTARSPRARVRPRA